jgi:hypothetical protein
MARQRRTYCMASTPARFEFSGFLPMGTPKNPFVRNSCWQRRGTSPSQCGCLSDYPKLSLNECGVPWWDVSRRALNLMEDILDTYYKCTFSAITHKLNVSGHMLMWTFFLVLVCGTRAQSLSTPFIYTLYIKKPHRDSDTKNYDVTHCFVGVKLGVSPEWKNIG